MKGTIDLNKRIIDLNFQNEKDMGSLFFFNSNIVGLHYIDLTCQYGFMSLEFLTTNTQCHITEWRPLK